jgi:DUF4097 and DUF4098 domain-containing protein YvlB
MTTLFLFLTGVLGTLVTSFGSGTYHAEFHQSYALEPHGSVVLENINGDVTITAWDRNEVKVDARKRALSQERLDDARVIVEVGRGSIAIRTQYPEQDTSDAPAIVDYNVKVPRAARLEHVKLVNGALEIAGLRGEVRASSVNGGIRTRGLAGDVWLSTVSGRLEAMFDEVPASRSISMNSVDGSIEVLLPMDARAHLQADTVSGGISSDFGLPVERGRFAGRHWSAALRGGGARIRVSNVNGSISLAAVWRGRRIRFT